MRAYAGYLKQEEKLNKSASGGAARALYENMLDRGGVVFGVCYDKDFRSARFQAVEEKRNLLPLLNTKYIYSEKKDTFREVEEYLAKGREVLFVGLGCGRRENLSAGKRRGHGEAVYSGFNLSWAGAEGNP